MTIKYKNPSLKNREGRKDRGTTFASQNTIPNTQKPNEDALCLHSWL